MRRLAQITALLDLQRRSLANAFRESSGRRGFGAALLIGMLWYGLWLGAAGVCAIAPRLIGYQDFEKALPGLLFFTLIYWQLTPLVTLTLGASLEMRKLAFYPLSTPALFAVECLLRLWSGFEIILVLCGLFTGLIAAGSPNRAGLAGGLVLFVAFNMFLAAGVRNLVERVFRKRLLREIVLTAMVSATLLPQALVFSETAREWAKAAIWNRAGVPYWLLPSGLAAHAGAGRASAGDWFLFVAMVAAAAAFGYRQFKRCARLQSGASAAVSAVGAPGAGLIGRIASLPWRLLPDPIGALTEKEVKYLWRSPRFRLPFFMGFTFGVIAWVPLMKRMEGAHGGRLETDAVSLISLYAFLLLGPVMFLNRFGFDRGAVRFYFWAPLRFEELLAAKNISTSVFAFLEMFAVAATCRLIGLRVGPAEVLEAAAVTLVALLFLLSVGNTMSVRFPTPSDPDRMSRAGGGHGVRAAAQFLLFPLSLAPLAGAFFLSRAWGGPASFVWALTGVGAIGALVYSFSFLKAAAHGRTHREELAARLSASAGPIAGE